VGTPEEHDEVCSTLASIIELIDVEKPFRLALANLLLCDRTDSAAYYNFGIALFGLAAYSAARSAYETAIRLDPLDCHPLQ